MVTSYISHQDCGLHNMGPEHPESPIRLLAIARQLERTGLQDHLQQITAVHVQEEQIKLAHAPLHSARLHMKLPEKGVVYTDDDTALCPDSLHAASLAAGATIMGVNRVVNGMADNAFCAVRPPGHHAEHNLAMGFCFYNNAAIGAMHALQQPGIERVAILDFDVHHCNGTVDIFKDKPEVLVCSTFQHPFYPERYSEILRPNIINCPLAAHSDGNCFRQTVETHWLPALQAHKPDLIIISAGFDAHWEDPMADLKLNEEDYRWVTRMIMDTARIYSNNRVVSVLEGGYNPSSLAYSVQAHIEVMLGF
ncbi:histone deacetylase family protein [Motiliproteus coralliicola]|uniref:Histone deacetylase family protein n=1 Tax=Motiliproteus coralliicola TaxID=2283196 RepID=A0A369WL78_9GAMM|nr:histone deacetylase family protein [Motiliproteus coralliicola]RDE22377.1 histone deacetylase family protein [Motiliproteus coralliicola]